MQTQNNPWKRRNELLLGLLCLFFILAVGNAKAALETTFAEKFEYIRRMSVTRVGVEAKLSAYEQLIKDYQSDPRVADVMLKAGHLALNSGDQEAGLRWLRRAKESSVQGAENWQKSRFALLARLPADSDEVSAIVSEISKSTSDSLILAKLEAWRQQVAMQKRDYKGVETHGNRLLNWYDDRKNVPSDIVKKTSVDEIIIGAGALLLESYVLQPLPKEVRESRIRDFEVQYGAASWVYRHCQMARERLKKQPDVRFAPRQLTLNSSTSKESPIEEKGAIAVPLPSTPRNTPASTIAKSEIDESNEGSRWILVVGNIGVLILIGLWWKSQRRTNQEKSPDE